MKLKILIFIIALGLSGCYNTTTSQRSIRQPDSGSNSRPHKKTNPIKVTLDDQLTTYHAMKALRSNPAIGQSCRVAVSTLHHSVLLVGEAPTAELKQTAQDIVKTVPHVKRIYNEITINPPIDIYQQGKDVMITFNVKSRILATDTMRSGKIRVITENGTVYLMGAVTHEQGNNAAQIVANSAGVQGVVKAFEYIG